MSQTTICRYPSFQGGRFIENPLFELPDINDLVKKIYS